VSWVAFSSRRYASLEATRFGPALPLPPGNSVRCCAHTRQNTTSCVDAAMCACTFALSRDAIWRAKEQITICKMCTHKAESGRDRIQVPAPDLHGVHRIETHTYAQFWSEKTPNGACTQYSPELPPQIQTQIGVRDRDQHKH
jgi:hypothetical protein